MSIKRSSAKIKRLLKILGPGLITGASDNDPSGIATYSQAGARFGVATLWTALVTFPLMAAIQEMCARIGMVTAVGLTITLKRHYSKPILYLMVFFTVPAIVLNIGADIAGMSAVANLIMPTISKLLFSILFTLILLALIIFLPYQKIVVILKYLCLSLFLYVVVPFFTMPNWSEALKSTFIPNIKWSRDFLEIVVAILGTTISPYLFFWQVSMEAKGIKHSPVINASSSNAMQNSDSSQNILLPQSFMNKLISKMQLDVNFGMLLSNFVMYFIILTTGTALFANGLTEIETVDQAASALIPVAGKSAYFLFAIGVMGTGFLAIPVLSATLSYIISETFGWDGDLDKKYYQAKAFYLTIAISLIIGSAINYVGITPIKALVYTAILYGLTSPILIAIVLHVANNKDIMKEYTNGTTSNVLGAITLLLMTASAIGLIYFQF